MEVLFGAEQPRRSVPDPSPATQRGLVLHSPRPGSDRCNSCHRGPAAAAWVQTRERGRGSGCPRRIPMVVVGGVGRVGGGRGSLQCRLPVTSAGWPLSFPAQFGGSPPSPSQSADRQTPSPAPLSSRFISQWSPQPTGHPGGPQGRYADPPNLGDV